VYVVLGLESWFMNGSRLVGVIGGQV
jgi:hypothetical protein